MTALASASANADVAVIGAGVAGLAAAGLLRRAGLRVELIEAGAHTGGRAYTDHPAALGRQAFDHGAQWLHAAHRNPLVGLARSRGETVGPDTPWDSRMQVLDPPGQPADTDAYGRAEAAWQAAVGARLAGFQTSGLTDRSLADRSLADRSPADRNLADRSSPAGCTSADCSLADAAAAVADDAWTATIETWEGAIIAAADADALSLRDWHTNALDGENYVTPGGLGALLQRLLDTPAKLGVRATAVASEPGGVRVETSQGTLRAGAAIVTVSTGVLRAEAIAFSPALPNPVLAALDSLPMGLLSKIVLRAAGSDRMGLAPGSGVFRRVTHRGAPFLSAHFWADGSDLAVGFVGGRAAWALARDAREADAFMRAELAATFGHDAGHAFAPGAFATNWGTDPDFLGAYAYARPGHAGARATLAEPLWDGRLAFAGEAVATDGLAGTVAGAYQTGRAAAQRILEGFTATPACV